MIEGPLLLRWFVAHHQMQTRYHRSENPLGKSGKWPMWLRKEMGAGGSLLLEDLEGGREEGETLTDSLTLMGNS